MRVDTFGANKCILEIRVSQNLAKLGGGGRPIFNTIQYNTLHLTWSVFLAN